MVRVLVVVAATLLPGCIHSLSAGARGGISTAGNVRVGAPLAMGLPFRLESVPPRGGRPEHLLTVGLGVSVEALVLPDRGEAGILSGFGPVVQYAASLGPHGLGVALRGGPLVSAIPARDGDGGGESVTGVLGLDFSYRLELGEPSVGYDPLGYSGHPETTLGRNVLALSLGSELAPAGIHKYTDDPEVFFLVGASYVREQMLEVLKDAPPSP